jgi:hypothetical protein
MPDGVLTFNSPIETGVRALILLAEAYPQGFDLQRILEYDYMMVHTGDFENGPPSIHPALPLRSGELLVRRELIDRGLMLMVSRALATRQPTKQGFAHLMMLDHFSIHSRPNTSTTCAIAPLGS